ncbi:MAG: nitroreductase family protein, partial [Rhodoferax sp.]
RLLAPGPNPAQLARILDAAASAPDHEQLLPWRFIVLPEATRGLLAEQFADALRQRDAQVQDWQLARAREKAFRAPLLMLLVVDTQRGGAAVDAFERVVSAGCAVQNVLLMATALGFGSALTSGKALQAVGLRSLLQLQPHDRALCFVSIGTPQQRKPARVRPQAADYTQHLSPQQGVLPGYASD